MHNLDGVDAEMKQRSLETSLKVEDQRTMQSYNMFKYLPESDDSNSSKCPYLLLELSYQPVILTISVGQKNLQQIRNNAHPEEMKELGIKQPMEVDNDNGATGGSQMINP